jgi:hypothetical protein
VFDLKGNPSVLEQSFLPLKARLISDRTLPSLLIKDFNWVLFTYAPFKYFMKDYFVNLNRKVLSLVEKEAALKKSSPRFIYAHLFMPHPPYIFTSGGQRIPDGIVYRQAISDPVPAYLGYLKYTNGKIRNLVTDIQNRKPNAVIILMGDHGYRYNKPGSSGNANLFKNLNAIYYPDKNYAGLYDSITGVNQFRVVINKIFNQNLPLLKDSIIELREINDNKK